MIETGFLSFGSNLGDKEANIAGAITALSTFHEISDLTSASFYNSPPLYNKEQPDFLNTVVKYTTTFSAFELLMLAKMLRDFRPP